MAYTKPLPVLEGLAGEFYSWCRVGELRFQRCNACKAWRHVPRVMCAKCSSMDWSWERSSGRGHVFTWTVTAAPLHPGFTNATPYAPVVIEMDEGVRIVSEMVDVNPEGLRIGMIVEVAFDAVTPEVTLPKFRSVR